MQDRGRRGNRVSLCRTEAGGGNRFSLCRTEAGGVTVSLCTGQQCGCGRFRAGASHGGGQGAGDTAWWKDLGAEAPGPQEEVHGGGEPLLDGPRDDPR